MSEESESEDKGIIKPASIDEVVRYAHPRGVTFERVFDYSTLISSAMSYTRVRISPATHFVDFVYSVEKKRDDINGKGVFDDQSKIVLYDSELREKIRHAFGLQKLKQLQKEYVNETKAVVCKL